MPNWPPTRSLLITKLRDAFRKRSKAIGHHVSNWTCEGEMDGKSDPPQERLTFKFNRWGKEYVALNAWEDGVLFFYACAWNGKQMSFEFSFDAVFNSETVNRVRELTEDSFLHVSAPDSSPEAKAKLLELWAGLDPRNINYGRA